ncbi:MAG TPA: HopJ type III effector protein [Methylococcaceae bacterium]|nr:HopJ type III effector protein [Methylococcaceae bacterium]
MNTQIEEFLAKVKRGERVAFSDTLAVISQHYDYRPTRFFNGIGEGRIVNEAGANEGSCKIFYFAKLHDLSAGETLALFGDHYWRDVLEHPDAAGHANIRTFMKHGWAGIAYEGEALHRRD